MGRGGAGGQPGRDSRERQAWLRPYRSGDDAGGAPAANAAGDILQVPFEINGTQEDTWKFIDSLQIFSLLANVADVKSLVIHPYTTTHSQLSPEELAEQHITPTTVRLSIGVEHIDDILDDLEQALAKI